MRTSLHTLPRFLLTLMCSSLAACGGGSDIATSVPGATASLEPSPTGNAPTVLTATTAAQAAYIPQSRGTTSTTSPTTSTTPVTFVALHSNATGLQSSAAATFGQVFAEGDVRPGESLIGKTAEGTAVPLQVDVKARHPDGSLRHAVITAQLPSIAPNDTHTVSLYRSTTAPSTAQATPATLLNAGFTAAFTATIGGVQYTASADEALKSGRYATWLSGPLVNEWLVAVPLKTAAGTPHPHLMARFAIRSYSRSQGARVDVTIENGWAYEAGPQNFTYDAQVLVGGQTVFNQAQLTHYHHARWRKVFTWGQVPALEVRHNTAYLLASKALPNYDQSLVIKEATIASWNERWNTSKLGPMEAGVGKAYMPTTGARPDIGPMPAWNALYLLSMDQRMKTVALGMSEQAASWSTHYRNKSTDRPVTLAEYPYMTAMKAANDTKNPATGVREAFPECPTTLCTTPMTADTAHQAAFSYVPYLVTGDYYHLEELQFWANWSTFYSNPVYREGVKGLVKPDQVRGQAWTLRTVAEAAYITPDNDPQKANFMAIVQHNIKWYNTTYTNNADANKLGVLDHGSLSYNEKTGIAPWQDDFFTTSVGRLVELGFADARVLLAWKSKFAVDRMVTDGACWIDAPMYSMKVRDTATTPLYSTFLQVYQANHSSDFLQLQCGGPAMATLLKVRIGEMTGDSTPSGSQAIMQPALAYSVGANSNGSKAWELYASRSYKPDYASQPQYAIVPR